MINDITSVYRTIPQWDTYQTGLEALATTLAPLNMHQHGRTKKSMTISDLLVKVCLRNPLSNHSLHFPNVFIAYTACMQIPTLFC